MKAPTIELVFLLSLAEIKAAVSLNEFMYGISPVIGPKLSLDYQPVSNQTKRGNPPAHSKLLKRQGVRIDLGCPAAGMRPRFDTFSSSWCGLTGNARDYWILCKDTDPPNPISFATGSCRDDELCFTRPETSSFPMMAVCVSGPDQIMLQQSADGREELQVTDQPWSSAPTGSNFQVVLTERSDSNVLFNVRSMSMVPRDIHNVPMGPAVSCADCNHLVYVNAPANTANFDITMENPTSDGILMHAWRWSS